MLPEESASVTSFKVLKDSVYFFLQFSPDGVINTSPPGWGLTPWPQVIPTMASTRGLDPFKGRGRGLGVGGAGRGSGLWMGGQGRGQGVGSVG